MQRYVDDVVVGLPRLCYESFACTGVASSSVGRASLRFTIQAEAYAARRLLIIRADNWVLWFIVGLVLIIGCTALAVATDDEDETTQARTNPDGNPNPNSSGATGFQNEILDAVKPDTNPNPNTDIRRQ